MAATQAVLTAAAGKMEAVESAEPEVAAPKVMDAAEAPWQSPSAYGTAMEGALMGFKPFLYPWPPGLTLFAFFAGAVIANKLNIEVNGAYPDYVPYDPRDLR